MIDQHCIFQDFDDLFCFESYCLYLHWLILLLVGVSQQIFSPPFHGYLNWCVNLGGHHSLGIFFVLIEITLWSGFLCCFFLFLFFFGYLFWFIFWTWPLPANFLAFGCSCLLTSSIWLYMLLYWILKFNLHSRPFSAINGSINYRCSVPLILIDDINIFFQLFKKC